MKSSSVHWTLYSICLRYLHNFYNSLYNILNYWQQHTEDPELHNIHSTNNSCYNILNKCLSYHRFRTHLELSYRYPLSGHICNYIFHKGNFYMSGNCHLVQSRWFCILLLLQLFVRCLRLFIWVLGLLFRENFHRHHMILQNLGYKFGMMRQIVKNKLELFYSIFLRLRYNHLRISNNFLLVY